VESWHHRSDTSKYIKAVPKFFLEYEPKHTQVLEDNANSVHEGETGISLVRGEEWTFICPIDLYIINLIQAEIILDLLFLIASLSGCEKRVFNWPNLLIQGTGTCQRK
jgi:hypothetical protein